MPSIVLLGTLDTKGAEYAYLRACVVEAGGQPLLVDCGVLGEPGCAADIPAGDVAAAGGAALAALRSASEGSDARTAALAVMRAGAVATLTRLYAEGSCDGVLAAAGAAGAAVVAAAMAALPLGVPKLLVSSVAAAPVGDLFGDRDITLMNAVTEIAGLNRVVRRILRNAAFAIVGMAGAGAPPAAADRKLVALSMLGITAPGVQHVAAGLHAAGFETITFQAVGAGGRAMEEMIGEGLIDGVIDLTVSELTDEYLGGIFSAGPARLETAGAKGIPQVVVPGALEVLNFGPRASVPRKYDRPERRLIVPTPQVTAVKVSAGEGRALAGILAAKLNRATGPLTVLLPRRGLDAYQMPPDGPWIEPLADAALLDNIRASLKPGILCLDMPYNINDPAFAAAAVAEFLRLWAEREASAAPRR